MSADPVTAVVMRALAREAGRRILNWWRRLPIELKLLSLLAALIGTPLGMVTLLVSFGVLSLLSPSGGAHALPPPAPAGGQVAPAVDPWTPLAEQIATEHGLDPALVLAVIEAESGGDPLAVSPAGALGLMQVMPDKFGPNQDPFDPETNLRAGCVYLRKMLDRYGGDVELALAAYNAGPGAVDEWGGVPPYPETVEYIERVMLLYAEMSENPDQPVREAGASTE